MGHRRNRAFATIIWPLILILTILPGTIRAQDGDTITIEFWHSYPETGPDAASLVTDLIPQFEAEHPGVRVQPVAFPAADFRRNLLAALASGDGPDAARLDVRWLPELADLGLLEPLDTMLPDYAALAEPVFPGLLAATTYRDHSYGLPVDASTRIWAWNGGMFGVAGLDQPATLLTDLIAQCSAIHALGDDQYLFEDNGTTSATMLPWLWSMGGAVTDAEITTAVGYLNGPATVAAYTSLLELEAAGCFGPALLDVNQDPIAHFLAGTTAATLAGPEIFTAVEAQTLYIDLKTSPMPALLGDSTGSITVAEGSAIVVIAASALSADHAPTPAETAATLDLVRFTQSDAYQLAMIAAGHLPAKSTLSTSEAIQNHPYAGAYLAQLVTARALPAHPAWDRIDAILTEASQRILARENDDDQPQPILDDAAARIDLILAEYR